MDPKENSEAPATPGSIAAERQRVADLLAAGDNTANIGGIELARELIAEPGANQETFKARLWERMRGSTKPFPTHSHPPGIPYGDGARTAFPSGKLRAFDKEEDAHRAGMWLRATLLNDKQAVTWCRDQNVRAMGEGNLVDGGASVPIEMASAYIRLVEQYGVFRQNARMWPMNSDQLKIARRKTGLSVFLVGENAAASEAQQGWDNVTLSTKKFATLVRVSNELLEDTAIALADSLTQDIALAFATQEDQCGFIGDGTATYGGMRGLTQIIIDGSHNASKIAAAAGHHVFTTIDNTDLTALMAALPWYARKGAKWYCSSTCWDQVFSRLMAVAGGNRISDLSQAPREAYLGHEVIVSQTLPTGSGTDYTSKVMLMFGDLSMSSAFGNRRDLRVKADQSRYLENDQTAFMCTERFDIVNHSCGDNTTAGPVVGLIGTA